MQVGYVVYPAGGEIPRHAHLPVERHLVGSTEVLVIQQGRCEVDVYSEERRLVATRELGLGDILISVGGGHGFRVLEDLVLLEIKQGPYRARWLRRKGFDSRQRAGPDRSGLRIRDGCAEVWLDQRRRGHTSKRSSRAGRPYCGRKHGIALAMAPWPCRWLLRCWTCNRATK